MTKTDQTLFETVDILRALGLLSRLPISVNSESARNRGAAASWAFPVAGFAIGLVTAVVGCIASWVGFPPVIAAGVALATMIMVSGAMHEDGLADTADGLWGAYEAPRRLEIMKDSHIGAYGVIALVLSIVVRWAAIVALMENHIFFCAIIGVATLSRAPMVMVMARVENARDTGLSAGVGRPQIETALAAVAIALAIGIMTAGAAATLFGVVLVVLTTLGIVAIAREKIGGQTGDILGAVQQIAEIAVLGACLATIC